jgi:23S rRNA (uracil1939-C5)-methyltransferase
MKGSLFDRTTCCIAHSQKSDWLSFFHRKRFVRLLPQFLAAVYVGVTLIDVDCPVAGFLATKRYDSLPKNMRSNSQRVLPVFDQKRKRRKTNLASKRRPMKGQNRQVAVPSTAPDSIVVSTSTSPTTNKYIENQFNFVTNEQRLQSAIGCEHFGSCSGCVVDQNVGTVNVIRSAQMYFSSHSIRWDPSTSSVGKRNNGSTHRFQVIVPSSLTQWRTQAKLAVAPQSSSWSKSGCTFGLYHRGTHVVHSIPNCAVHHPSINRAVAALVDATKRMGTPTFDENNRHESGLRYIQLQVERTTGKVCLTLIWNSETLLETQPSLSRLVKELNRSDDDLWHSIWCHCNKGIGNNIFSRNPHHWHRISGMEFVRETFPVNAPGWMYYTPLTFRQGNLDGFDMIVNDVVRAIPGGSTVCELYAGVGLLALSALVYHATDNEEGHDRLPLKWIRCSDENPANKRCFQRSVDTLPNLITTEGSSAKPSLTHARTRTRDNSQPMKLAELAAPTSSLKRNKTYLHDRRDENRMKTSYMVASASTALRAGQALGASVLIVDPPRKGLEEEVLVELCKPRNPAQATVEKSMFLIMDDDEVNWVNDVSTLIYVSCSFDALARDCERLLQSADAGWCLVSATGFVLFPGTDHVETLCVFRRR